MEFQNIVIGLAIAAIALSITSIVFGIIFFRVQMQQARGMMKDTSDFAQRMNTLLNEIRISQNITGQQIKDQYDKLLDAALGGVSSAEAAATSAIQVEKLTKRLAALEKAAAGLQDSEKLDTQIRDLRKSMEALNITVRQLAARATEEEREGPRPKVRFEKFLEPARKALFASHDEAIRLNHDYIGPEHILLGLIKDNKNTASKVLTNLGVDLSNVKAAIEFLLPRVEKPVTAELRLAPQGKRVIELTVEECINKKATYVGTEHLLLGVLLEGGVAAGVLQNLGVTLEKARAEVWR